jgi:endonuclease/exonuclease/phosphatase family metal-dependent hydrolase
MSFNICMGGRSVDIAKVADAIVASQADVVGLQEAGANVALIARLVGWAHADERHQVISRWPIAEPGDAAGTYVYVLPTPATVVAIANVHLPSDPYGPYELRDGLGVDGTLHIERTTRLAALRRRTEAWTRLVDRGVPLVVTGDFNVPAHTDWGPGWSEHRSQPMAWPVSEEMTALGFTDTYRAVNPTRPGLTWTYGYPHPRGDGTEPRDRIDFVWSAGHDEITGSSLVGPAGVPDVVVDVDPWPSDHLGVVSAIMMTPVEPAPYVAPHSARVEVGDPLRVRFATPGVTGERIGVVATADAIDDALMWVAPMEVDRFGEVTFGTAHLAPGEYDIVLATGADEIGRHSTCLVARGELPCVETSLEGDRLTVRWRASYGRRFDWIGVYAQGDADLANGTLASASTRASVNGSRTFDGLGAGPFTVRLIGDSTIAVLAQTEIAQGAQGV